MRLQLLWILLLGISRGYSLGQGLPAETARTPLSVIQADDTENVSLEMLAELPPCSHDPGYCFEDDSITARLMEVTDGTQGNYNWIYLNMRIENHSTVLLLLLYPAHKSLLVDEFENTYFCCPGKDAPDTSATGIGILTDKGQVDNQPALRIEPGRAANITFTVSGHRARGQESPYFHYNVTLDEMDPKNPKRVQRQHALHFGDFTERGTSVH